MAKYIVSTVNRSKKVLTTNYKVLQNATLMFISVHNKIQQTNLGVIYYKNIKNTGAKHKNTEAKVQIK